ncbi:MAG TPA: sigma factor [Planctomicrobium sp.]|nr:sigma factor [Planctomicrobium sp.]
MTERKLNTELDEEAAEWWQFRDDPDVVKWLATHYLEFAKKLAWGIYHQNSHRSLEFQELACAASLGLLEAIHRFQPESNAAFTSFATWRIRGECVDVARANDWVPHSVRTREKKGKIEVPFMFQLKETTDLLVKEEHGDVPDLEAIIPSIPQQHQRIVRNLLKFTPEKVAHLEHCSVAAILAIAGRSIRLALDG